VVDCFSHQATDIFAARRNILCALWRLYSGVFADCIYWSNKLGKCALVFAAQALEGKQGLTTKLYFLIFYGCQTG
jgi:hypothetical protein